MSYRTQEILRMIIPGLYLIAMSLIIFLIGGGWNEINTENQRTIIEVLKGASNVVVLLLPFLGFVIGYLIECLMAFGERFVYLIGVRRPSKVVLGGNKMYVLDKLDGIKKALKVGMPLSNTAAGKALQEAKQGIDRAKVETFHDTSIMARNIMGSQLMLTIFTFCYNGLCTLEFLAMIVALVILVAYWYHRNCVYVKYVFSEFGKGLPKEELKNE